MNKTTRLLHGVILAAALCRPVALFGQTTFYVDAECGNDAWSGFSPDCVPADGPKRTIAAAIDIAISGDTILVAPGTYLENLNYGGRDIVITSTAGPETTIIDGRLLARSVILFHGGEGPQAVINGFSLINGSGTGIGTVLFGGAISISHASPTITQNIMRDNRASFGGAIDVDTGAPTIVGNLIINNAALDCDEDHLCGSGGGINLFNASAIIEQNVIQSNLAELHGGGIAIDGFSGAFDIDVICRDNLIVENTSANFGGGIYLFSRGNLNIAGTTLSRNTSGAGGDGLCVLGNEVPTATISNSIFHPNGLGDQEIAINGGEVTVRYSDIRNGQAGVLVLTGSLVWQAGNISIDPVFVAPGRSDYHLTVCSPAVNAGDPGYIPAQGEFDIDGQQRVMGTAIDMGADEVPHRDDNDNGIPDICECDPCDMNCDGAVDAFDIGPFLDLLFGGAKPCAECTGDADGNGTIDAFDIEPFLACLFG